MMWRADEKKSSPTEQTPVANVAIQGTKKGSWVMLFARRGALAVHLRADSARSIIHPASSIFLAIRATPFATSKTRKNWQNQNEATAASQKPFQRLAIATFRAPRKRFLTE